MMEALAALIGTVLLVWWLVKRYPLPKKHRAPTRKEILELSRYYEAIGYTPKMRHSRTIPQDVKIAVVGFPR